MTKKTLGKAMLNAGIISAGIAVAGLTFTGDAGLKNIENNLNNMKTEFTQVVSDNTFLRTQYEKLEGFYDTSVTKANEQIAKLTNQRDEYYTELSTLKNDIENTPTADEDRIEIQAEISRLEGELTKANTKIAELETKAKAIDESTVVDRVNKSEYTAKAVAVDSIPILVTAEALAINATHANRLAELSRTMKFTHSAIPLNNLVYESLTVIDGIFTYEVESLAEITNSVIGGMSDELFNFMKESNVEKIYLTDGSSQMYSFTYTYGTQGYRVSFGLVR